MSIDIDSSSANLLFTVVRIETNNGVGTAFLFSYEGDGKKDIFLVTNKHVVKNAEIGRFLFTLSDGEKPLIGQRFDVELDQFEKRWHGHRQQDIDVTIMPFSPVLQTVGKAGKQIYFRTLSQDLVPNQAQVNEFDLIETVLFIGYPIGLFDEVNLMPISRRGLTATPIQLDYNGKPVFLMDASVFPGSSGSPVFIYNLAGFEAKGAFVVDSRLCFIGIVAEVFYELETGEIEIASVPTKQTPVAKTPQMIDLGVVYKSSAVLETVFDFYRKNTID